MKKSLSIILIVAMLLSMVMVAIPAAAAEEDEIELPVKTWEKPWETGFTEDWIEIGSASEFISALAGARSGTHDNRQYYLTADIDLTTSTRGTSNPYNITIDGNGHSITIGGTCRTIFDNPGNLTLRNLIVKGDITAYGDVYGDNAGAWNDPFATWDHKGWLKTDNVVSAVNITYNRTINGAQRPSGLAGNIYAGSELKNTKYVGTIIIGPKAMVSHIGGLVGDATDTKFVNCTNEGTILFTGKFAHNATEGQGGTSISIGVGGIVGKTSGNCTFENCTNVGDIAYTGYDAYALVENAETGEKTQSTTPAKASGDKNINTHTYLGGISGMGSAGMSYTNCTNKGTIILSEADTKLHFGYVGGIFGGLDCSNANPVVMNNTHNTGDIVAVYPHTATIGGLVGMLRNNAPGNALDNCSNSGDIVTYNAGSRNTSYASIGGIIGYAYGAQKADYALSITNTSNSGNLTSNAKGKANKEIWGGFIGHSVGSKTIYFENCVNSGDVLMPTDRGSEFIEGSGGFIGGFRTFGDNWANAYSANYTFKNCVNTGDIAGMQAGGFYGDNAEVVLSDEKGYTVDKFVITFENCVNAGNVTAKTNAGGLVAMAGKGGGFTISVKNCSNGGNINGGSTSGGMFGGTTAASVTTVDTFVNYGTIGSADSAKAAGLMGGSDGTIDISNAINLGTVTGAAFGPFTNAGINKAENNKYLTSATIDDDFDGGEAVEDPETLINLANEFEIPYAANCGTILSLVETCKAMDPSDYLVGAKWEELWAACDAAKAALGAEDFDPLTYTQKQANDVYLSILKYLVTVVEKADVSELNTVLAEAQGKLAGGKEYTAATLKNLQDAIDTATVVSAQGEAAKMTQVTECIEDLTKAMERLREVPAPTDYSFLEGKIADAEEKVEAEYTAETWEALQTALTAAKEALSAEKQKDVDTAAAALNKALAELEKKPEDTAPETQPATEPATEPVEDGCGSVIGGAAVILTAVVALGAGISFKKKED